MAIAANIQNIEGFSAPRSLYDEQVNRHVESRTHLQTHFDPSSNTQWTSFKQDAPTKMTKGIVDDLKFIQKIIKIETKKALENDQKCRIHYHVLASEIPNVFNLGGDLEYLSHLIRNKDVDALRKFSLSCVELIYNNAVSFGLPITTISLVQGTALAGGFEAALSSNVLIAERQSKMSLPEVMFNMFPGMGAYQLLCRRVPPSMAEKIILSGKTYTAEQMFDLGIVDILAEPGQGEDAVWSYIKRHQNQSNAEWNFRQMVNDVNPPIRLQDLEKSVEYWIESALKLNENDLKHIEFLIRVQRQTRH